MMLPPINKQHGGVAAGDFAKRERRGSTPAADEAGGHHTRVEGERFAANQGSPSGTRDSRENRDSSTHVMERMQMLERENDHFRDELSHLRQLVSNNNFQRDDDKTSFSKAADDLQRLVRAFNGKVQADLVFQQREQQKAALLFAEVARLGHSVEAMDHSWRQAVEEAKRKLDHYHDQQLGAQQSNMALVYAGNASRHSPTKASQNENHRIEEAHQSIVWMKHALAQLRSEVESDRNEQWKSESERSQAAADLRAALAKTDATMEARIASHLERVHSKLMADKMEMMRALDEFRELMTGSDFKRMSSQMMEFTRINDHLLVLERWIHGEHGKIKRVLQSLQTEQSGRVQAIVSECAAALKMWSGLLQQQDDDWRVQFGMIQEAVVEMAHHIQRKVFALEEVVPMEVLARQRQDDKLKRRIESVGKSLARAMDVVATCRSEASRLAATNDDSRIMKSALELVPIMRLQLEKLEASQTQFENDVKIEMAEIKQQRCLDRSVVAGAVQETADNPIVAEEQAELSGGGSAAAIATAREANNSSEETDGTGDGAVTVAVEEEVSHALTTEIVTNTSTHQADSGVMVQWQDAMELRLSDHTQILMDELTGRHNDLLLKIETVEMEQGQVLASLQRWTVAHAQECRECYAYFQWTLEQTQVEELVRQTLQAVVDGVVAISAAEAAEEAEHQINTQMAFK